MIDNMRKIGLAFGVVFLVSCTSNTIFEAPEDLIPKDSMQLLIKDMLIASSSRYFNNRNLQKNIDYMPFVYKKYGIDSARFGRSNFYYMSRIDEYRTILEQVKEDIENEKTFYTDLKAEQDSIKKDSINKAKIIDYQKKDSIKRSLTQKTSEESLSFDTIQKKSKLDSLRRLAKETMKKVN